jgi:hypothetical protein
MPYSGDVVKYVVGGAIGSDQWSIGAYQRLNGLSSNPTPTQMNTAALARLNGFNTIVWSAATAGLKSVNATGVALSIIKSYLYRGGVLTAQGNAAITAVPGTGSANLPFFTALCCSLLTNTPGRSGRGRLYLPFTAGALTATGGQTNIGSLSQYAGNVASWLSGLGGNDNLYPGDPTSAAVVLSNTKSAVYDVVTTRIDSIPDTQHGRTRKDVAASVGTGTL